MPTISVSDTELAILRALQRARNAGGNYQETGRAQNEAGTLELKARVTRVDTTITLTLHVRRVL